MLRVIVLAMVAFVGGWIAPPGASALDGAPWDRVLRAHAREGSFDYEALSRDEAARSDLRAFLEAVATMREDEPLASWLDAYNALVIASVIERWPVQSVRAVPGFFDRIAHRVAGQARTLDDVEHRIIRARFPDARVHAALVCGARSCPALHGRAFRSSDLDATLDRLSRAWLASPRHLQIENGRVRASAIFAWYRADFERDAGSVLGWLRRHAPDRARGVPDGARIEELSYDWALNSTR